MSTSKIDKTAEKLGKAVGTAGVLIAIVAVVCILFLPFYFAYLYLSSKAKIGEILAKGITRKNIWLSSDEKIRYKGLLARANEAKSLIDRSIRTANENGITKNQDGRYSARSNLGKEIRNTIEANEEILENAVREIRTLQEKPLTRWNSYDRVFKRKKATAAALISCLVFSPVALTRMIRASHAVSPDYPPSVQYVFWWCITAMVGGIVYKAFEAYSSSPFENHINRPPKVDLANLEQWDSVEQSVKSLDVSPEGDGKKVLAREQSSCKEANAQQAATFKDENQPVLPKVIMILSYLYLGFFLLIFLGGLFDREIVASFGDFVFWIITICVLSIPGGAGLYFGLRLKKAKGATTPKMQEEKILT